MSVIRVLSAGAPKGGVGLTAEAFESDTGHSFQISFATAPTIRAAVEGGTAEADVVVATADAVEAFGTEGLTLEGAMTVLGSIKAGVVIRIGADVPDISSAETLKQALLDAQSIVRNEASSGLYIARMIEGLGIADQVKDKTVTLPTGGDVLAHLAESDVQKEIGFGQLTEIRRLEPEGRIRLVGALPKEVENITTYAAAPLAGARDPDAAKAYVGYLATDAARKILVASGVE
ncbi:MAG: substrate-binding domain-containing protein [Alphaproteobacteria bacterium]|nr:substrate-binding domain-containing protein [Alphaproteobacteria bacterium]